LRNDDSLQYKPVLLLSPLMSHWIETERLTPGCSLLARGKGIREWMTVPRQTYGQTDRQENGRGVELCLDTWKQGYISTCQFCLHLSVRRTIPPPKKNSCPQTQKQWRVTGVLTSVHCAGGYDHICKLWDVRTTEATMSLDHGAPIEALAYFPSGAACWPLCFSACSAALPAGSVCVLSCACALEWGLPRPVLCPCSVVRSCLFPAGL
jgi:hypothetical protein